MNETEFDSLFWITIIGLLFTFGGLVLQAVLKSRCHHVRCACFECTRDLTADTQEVDLDVPDFTTRRPWFETEMTIGFRPRRGRNATLNLIFFFEKRVVRVIKINFF